MFKTHVDIFDHWDASVADRLRQLADKHGRAQEPICLLLVCVYQHQGYPKVHLLDVPECLSLTAQLAMASMIIIAIITARPSS